MIGAVSEAELAHTNRFISAQQRIALSFFSVRRTRDLQSHCLELQV